MRVILGVLLAVGALVGCGEVKAKPDGGGPADGSMPDSSGLCTANAKSCMDTALFQCDAEGQQETKIQDCQYGCTSDHCNACAANTTFCSGDDVVMCDGNGQITNPQNCQFGCQNAACNACSPGSSYCSGATAIMCGTNGQPGQMTNCGAPGCASGVCNSCTPNTTTCQGDNLVVCNSGGTVASATTCALGCGTSGGAHCKQLVPSYGVPAPSGSLPALAITDNSTLDITDCANLNVLLTIGSTTTAVPTGQIAVHAQTNGPPICVIKYGTITINDPYTLSITNSATLGHALSLEATGDIDISGKIAFFNAAQGPAPGGVASANTLNSNNKYMANGAGGAGGVRAGGFGGKCVACNGGSDINGAFPGDPVTTASTILDGGSVGGHVYNGSSAIVAYGGAGGGGLQLVSLTRVTLPASGVINLNGGAGTGPGLGNYNQTAGGGGSGGTLVVEAPVINVSAGAIAAANGGGGAGGCWYSVFMGILKFFHYNGQPGQLSTTRAAGGDCPNTSNGDGGYEANGDAAPSINGQPSDSGAATQDGGGGGGSSGFIILRGRVASNVMIAFGAIISPAPTTGAVTAQ